MQRVFRRFIKPEHPLAASGQGGDVEQAKRPQLQMIWPRSRLMEPPVWTVPEGYALRTYQSGDEPRFLRLMDCAEFKEWDMDRFQLWFQKILPDGLFFVVHQESGQVVATGMTLHAPTIDCPFRGSLEWVATDPAHRGKGLGHAVSAAATRHLLEAGYRDICLQTDDWRLPALKMYLKLGWVPFLSLKDSPGRWRAVCETLEWPYTPEVWPRPDHLLMEKGLYELDMTVIDNPPVELWDQVVSQSEYATFFHTSTWAQILAQTYPHFQISTKGFVLHDGVVAIVPLMDISEQDRSFKWHESMFPGVYGGAVAERHLTQAEISYIFQHLAKARTACIHVIGNPSTDYTLPSSYSRSLLCTHVLTLDKGYDAIFKNYSRGRKSSVKKARKMGVEIGVAETEEEFRSYYYEVYQDSLRRWEDNVLANYPYSLFEQIYQRRSESMKLWVAKVDGEIVSGNLIFYHNRHVVYWHGATRESYFSYRPGCLLMTEIIRDACQKGFRYYDFNPSGGLKGVETYKERFGAQRVHFYSYVWNHNRVHRAYHKTVTLVRALLRRTAHNRDQKEALGG